MATTQVKVTTARLTEMCDAAEATIKADRERRKTRRLERINKSWYARLYTRLTGKPWATELGYDDTWQCLVGSCCSYLIDELRPAIAASGDGFVLIDIEDLDTLSDWQPNR